MVASREAIVLAPNSVGIMNLWDKLLRAILPLIYSNPHPESDPDSAKCCRVWNRDRRFPETERLLKIFTGVMKEIGTICGMRNANGRAGIVDREEPKRQSNPEVFVGGD